MVDQSYIDLTYQVLETVKDPEIPVLSVLELGMIESVEIIDNDKVLVTFIPTFSACPALDHIKENIYSAVSSALDCEVEVKVNRYKPWTTDLLSAEAKEKLENYGLGTPQFLGDKELTSEDLEYVKCPHCKSDATSLTNPFGSALCRSMHYCHNCGNSFERIKPIQ